MNWHKGTRTLDAFRLHHRSVFMAANLTDELEPESTDYGDTTSDFLDTLEDAVMQVKRESRTRDRESRT